MCEVCDYTSHTFVADTHLWIRPSEFFSSRFKILKLLENSFIASTTNWLKHSNQPSTISTKKKIIHANEISTKIQSFIAQDNNQ